MPEKQSSKSDKVDDANKNETSADSPKRNMIKGKNVLAKVTLLDGTIREFSIEVTSYVF